ncbi:MAG: endonuclease MutS2 [Myxococcota bacterium]
MDLEHDTLVALDWPVCVEALAERARTALGSEQVRAMAPLASAEEIRRCHDAIDELFALEAEGEHLPVGGVSDVRSLVRDAAKARMLDGSDLRLVGLTLGALRDLAWFTASHQEVAPVLGRIGSEIFVDDVVADELMMAFEPSGELSERTYPELADLRRRIADLHTSIRETLGTLLRSETLEDVLQDDYVTQRNDRYVLPIKAHAKRWDLGIVHGTSGSGQTVYIEPNEVVTLNNRLRLAEGELLSAERRILTQLSRLVGEQAEPIELGLVATTRLDLHCARHALARDLDATRPQVGEGGTVDMTDARHPLLVLRKSTVVGNDLAVGQERPALVLSGPNAGGKTVSLKTLALCVLLVRFGCFVPAAEGSRVDRFDTVLAAIGDAQSVEGDLSSFSGHLLVLSTMLKRAGPNTLLLLDEIASGTDPAQGAPLAQAVLEALLDQGPRLVVTTHFARLKILPETDQRFSASAVEYANGRPTYRVVPGALGESHALSIATEMGLSPNIIQRARDLMGAGERGLADTLASLERARQAATQAQREAEEQTAALAARERSVRAREADLQRRVDALKAEASAAFLQRIEKADKAVAAVVADLQRDPSHAKIAAGRSTLNALRGLVPQSDSPEPIPTPISVGDRVRLTGLGGRGEVVSVQGQTVQVKTGSVTLKVPKSQVEPDTRPPLPSPFPSKPTKKKTKKAPSRSRDELLDVLRLPGNTVDLRGQRVEEATAFTEAFFDTARLRGHDIVFVLHGHGTGALKQAIRRWLPSATGVGVWVPAGTEQGGDAYTVVCLDG